MLTYLTMIMQEKINISHAATFLIQKGCNPSALNSKSSSALAQALQLGCFSLAQKFLDLKCEIPETPDESFNTILHHIIPHLNNPAAVSWYKKSAQHSANIENFRKMAQVQNKDGLTALQLALTHHCNTNFQIDTDKPTPKHFKDPLVELVTFLVETLKSNVNVVTADDYKNTTLHLATLCKNNATEIIPILLKAQADINSTNADGRTPLNLAVLKYLTETAKFLIKQGANVNITSEKDGGTPLILLEAMKQSNTFCLIPLMIEKGGKVEARNKETGNTVLHYVALKPELPFATEAIEALLKKGVLVNQCNQHGMTPLHLAVNSRESEIDSVYRAEDILITAGADMRKLDITGRIPLHYTFLKCGKPEDASTLDPIELCMMLVSSMKEKIYNGQELLRTKDEFGATPLHLAAKRGATICCSYLISEKPDILNDKDMNGNSPFALAVMHGHQGCSLYFQQQGADFLQLVNFNEKQGKQKEEFELCWEFLKLQNEEDKLKSREDKIYSILQAVMEKDWQGIVFLMIAALKNRGLGAGPGIYAAIKANRFKLALKLMGRVKSSNELHLKENNGRKETLLHVLCQVKISGATEEQIQLQLKLFHALLSNGVPLNELDATGTHPLIYASQERNIKLCNEILDTMIQAGIDLESIKADVYGRAPFTALFWKMDATADFQPVKKWATAILDEGVTANFRCRYPVIISSYPGARCVILKSENSTFMGSQHHLRTTPLIISVLHGNYDAVKWLVSLGKTKIDVNFADQNGMTALMHAVRLNDVKMVRFLLSPTYYSPEKDVYPWENKNVKNLVFKSNQNLKAQDKNGWTVLDHLVCPIKSKNLHFVNFQSILEHLTHAGGSLSDKSGDGLTPVDRAVETGWTPLVTELNSIAGNPKPGKFPVSANILTFKKIPSNKSIEIDSSTYKKAAQDLVDAELAKQMETDQSEFTITPDPLLNMPEDNCVVVMDSEQNIPFDCVMTKVDIGYGTYGLYNFYKMQLVKQPRGKELVVLFTQWARVGDTGQFQKTPFTSEEEGIKEFKKIFKAKSGNAWENCKDFSNIPKKYRLVNKELRNVKNAKTVTVDFNKLKACAEKSKGNRNVDIQTLFKTIIASHEAHFSKQITQPRSRYYRGNPTSSIVTNNLPFGRLTTEIFKKGDHILLEIGKLIEEKTKLAEKLNTENIDINAQQEALMEKMAQLSEEFYALVPIYGFQAEKLSPMFTMDDVREKQTVIYNLIQTEFAKELLLSAQANADRINPFEYIYGCLKTTLCKLDYELEDKEETQLILQYIHNTKDSSQITVKGIYRIQREQENEFVVDSNRWLLWHGTNAVNILSVLHHGLQVTPLGAKLSGNLFGKVSSN